MFLLRILPGVSVGPLLAASRHLEKVGPSSAVHFVIWIKFHQFGKILAPPTEYRQHLSKPTADILSPIFSLTSMNVLGSSCSNSHVTKALHSRKQSRHNICFLSLCILCSQLLHLKTCEPESQQSKVTTLPERGPRDFWICHNPKD